MDKTLRNEMMTDVEYIEYYINLYDTAANIETKTKAMMGAAKRSRELLHKMETNIGTRD